MPSEDVLARLEALEARVRARDAEIERLKRSPEAAPREPTAQELMLRQRAENRRSLSFFPQAQDRIQTLHNAMTGLSIPFARKATALYWLRFGRWPDARRLTPEQATLLRSDARRLQNAGNVPAERSGVEWPTETTARGGRGAAGARGPGARRGGGPARSGVSRRDRAHGRVHLASAARTLGRQAAAGPSARVATRGQLRAEVTTPRTGRPPPLTTLFPPRRGSRRAARLSSGARLFFTAYGPCGRVKASTWVAMASASRVEG